jgi:hypothetical protein
LASTSTKKKHSEKNTYGLPRGDKIRRELRAWFGRQRKAVLHYIATGEIRTKDESGGDLPPSIPDFDAFGLGSLPMSERMVPLIGAIWDDAGQSFNARLGLDPDSFSVTNPNTKEAVEKATLEFCESTNATTHLELTEALQKTREAIAEGLIVRGDSVADLTKRVNEIFSGAETWRARRIAATEASRAVHAAQEMSAIDSEVVTGWKWLLSADACPLCQTVARRVPAVRLGRPFAIIGDNPAYANISHPPLHPGCQCSLQEVLDIDPQPEWAAPLIDPKPEEQDYAEGEAPAPKQPKPPAAQKPQALPPKRNGSLLSRAEDQAGVAFVPPENADPSEYKTVVVSVAKVDADLAKDPDKYVGRGGEGAGIAGRYANFREFLARARERHEPIEQPRASLAVDTGRIAISDGRHRFAVFRDEGQALLPLTVPKDEAAKIRRMYGAKP